MEWAALITRVLTAGGGFGLLAATTLVLVLLTAAGVGGS